MLINSSLNVPQVVDYVMMLFFVAQLVAPVVAYFLWHRSKYSMWYYLIAVSCFSVLLTLTFSWFDDYSTQLKLAYYGYDENLVNEFANVAPENMDSVNFLLDCGHVDIEARIINSFIIVACLAYNCMVFFLLNILVPMFQDDE